MALYRVPVTIIETVEKTGVVIVEAEDVREAAELALCNQIHDIEEEELVGIIKWDISEADNEHIELLEQ